MSDHPPGDADRHAWENPGAFEVAPGVHRIPLPLPGDNLKAVNIYAIADGEQVVLIDGGWALAEAEDLLAAGLKSIGYGLRDVREFLVTHLHRDHYTQAIALRRAYGGSVSVGEGEQACLRALHTVEVHPDIERMHEAGRLELSRELAKWERRSRPHRLGGPRPLARRRHRRRRCRPARCG